MSEVKSEEIKKELTEEATSHRGKLILVGLVSIIVAAWNYIAVPVAATHGLVLPPMPIEKIISFLMMGGL